MRSCFVRTLHLRQWRCRMPFSPARAAAPLASTWLRPRFRVGVCSAAKFFNSAGVIFSVSDTCVQQATPSLLNMLQPIEQWPPTFRGGQGGYLGSPERKSVKRGTQHEIQYSVFCTPAPPPPPSPLRALYQWMHAQHTHTLSLSHGRESDASCSRHALWPPWWP